MKVMLLFARALFVLTVALHMPLPSAGAAEPSEVPGLLKEAQLAAKHVNQVSYYYCPRGAQCTARCSAGEGHISIDYSNVKRLEIGTASQEFLIGIHYADPIGKPHVIMAFLPLPTSCVFDDLVIDTIAPVEHGIVIKPDKEVEVIFDVEQDG
jgi:hypothetical protein|tara:strand:- start:6547 stop:7005 length:459 start_codon:yes stop_codon:yes gene_type:complete